MLAKGYKWTCCEIGWKSLCGHGSTVWGAVNIAMPDGTHKRLNDMWVNESIAAVLDDMERGAESAEPYSEVERRSLTAFTSLTPEQRAFIPWEQRRALESLVKDRAA